MSRVEKPHVLLADDNEATCTLITALLRREFTIDVARDGREAIEKLQTRRYVAMLLDLRMPQTDGFAVLNHLQAADPKMLRHILVVTAALTPKDMARARSFPICEIIGKPFDIEKLLSSVRHCAELSDDPREGGSLGNVLCSSGSMILLIADFLRQRLG